MLQMSTLSEMKKNLVISLSLQITILQDERPVGIAPRGLEKGRKGKTMIRVFKGLRSASPVPAGH